MPKIFSLKIHKSAGIKTKTFLNKGTKHKKNYIEGLNSKNKNINVADPFNFVLKKILTFFLF